jgi:hypothetical protein
MKNLLSRRASTPEAIMVEIAALTVQITSLMAEIARLMVGNKRLGRRKCETDLW